MSFLRSNFWLGRGGGVDAVPVRREKRQRVGDVRRASKAVREVVLVGGGHAHVAVVKSFAMEKTPARGGWRGETDEAGGAIRVTLVSRDAMTPYSGMLPGFVAGHYTLDECHIDLRRLVQRLEAMKIMASGEGGMMMMDAQASTNIRLVQAECVGIDTERREVLLAGDRPALRYDVLSLDVGITPAMLCGADADTTIPGTTSPPRPPAVVAVKPIDSFCARWESLLARFRESGVARNGKEGTSVLRVAVVGGGAGGVELALAMHHRLTTIAAEMADAASDGSAHEARTRIELVLFTRHEIMHTHGARARRIMLRIFGERGIALHEHSTVVDVDRERKELVVAGTRCDAGGLNEQEQQEQDERDDVTRFAFDECIWCTDARAAGWIAASGLACESKTGCVLVNEALQSESREEVFAAGDCSHCPQHPRPKAGVFAVRAGMPLAENLKRFLAGRPLLPFTPQSTFLGLISTGNKYAVATKAGFAFEAGWMWHWKDYIDRTWMAQYGSDLDGRTSSVASTTSAESAATSGLDALAALSSPPMRCGGCGAKVGATVLSNVMRRLGIASSLSSSSPSTNAAGVKRSKYEYRRDEVIIGLGSPDDAAVVSVPRGMVTVQTIDFFRSFVADLYVFGRIAANHALSDCHAMGASPISAMAIAMVAYSPDEAKMEEDLYQMMAGAASVLVEERCALVGGHTCEGAELGLGFAVVGADYESNLLRKGGMCAGDALILTKPIGTGVLLAADMRGEANGRWVQNALETMQVSSREAAAILRGHGATSCTDVTGFGLLGHALEMARASDVAVEISTSDVPLLEGALDCVRRGIFSSLQPQNIRIARAVRWAGTAAPSAESPVYPLLFDPQTAGGLLASVPSSAAAACVDALRRAGYAHTAIIGSVLPSSDGDDRCSAPLVLL